MGEGRNEAHVSRGDDTWNLKETGQRSCLHGFISARHSKTMKGNKSLCIPHCLYYTMPLLPPRMMTLCQPWAHPAAPAQGQHSLSTLLQSVGNQSALKHQSNRKVPAILTDHHGTRSDKHLSHAWHSMVTTSAWLHLAFPSPPVAASWKFLLWQSLRSDKGS